MENKMICKPGTMFYHDFFLPLEDEDSTVIHQLFFAALKYSAYGELPDGLHPTAAALFKAYRNSLGKDTENYLRKKEASRKAGLASAQARRRRIGAGKEECSEEAADEIQQPLTDDDESWHIQPTAASTSISASASTPISTTTSMGVSSSASSSAALKLPPEEPVSPEIIITSQKKEEEVFPPTREMVDAYIREKGWDGVDADDFLERCREADWKDGNGEPVRNWRMWLKGYIIRQKANAVRTRCAPDPRIAELERLKQKYISRNE